MRLLMHPMALLQREIFQEIDGFKELYGKSLFNCPYCDGWELRDQPLVIVEVHPL